MTTQDLKAEARELAKRCAPDDGTWFGSAQDAFVNGYLQGVARPRPDAGEGRCEHCEEVREGLGQTIDAIERRMEQCSTMENGRLARRMLAEVRDFAMSRLSLLSPKQEGKP